MHHAGQPRLDAEADVFPRRKKGCLVAIVGIGDRLPPASFDRIHQHRQSGGRIARCPGAHAFEIGAVKRDDVVEAVEVVAFDLAGGLPGDIHPVTRGDSDGARIGGTAEVVGRGSGGIDRTGKVLFPRALAECAFGHR